MKIRKPRTGRTALSAFAALGSFLLLSASPLPALAGPGLAASFLSSGISEALNDLGYFLDSPPPTGSINFNFSDGGTLFGCARCLWSVSLSGAQDGAETGATVLSSQDNDLQLAPIVLTGATETHGPRSIKFKVTTPRILDDQQDSSNIKVFTLELGAAQPDTALEPGSYANASADPNTATPVLDVFLGVGSCHSATRSFVVDELVYVDAQLAKLTAHFQCGTRFAGVLHYDDALLSGTETVLVRGRVWEDENRDGMQAGDGLNAPDPVLSDVRVDLFSAGLRIAQTMSKGGDVSFMVPAGNYQVGVATPRGMQVTLRDVGGDESRDSDIDPVSGRSDVFDTNTGTPAAVTIGLSRPGGQPTLPLLSNVVQPLLAGNRVSYRESRKTEQLLATDTVLPGSSVMSGSSTRRVTDTAGNLQYLSNDTHGLRLHRAVMLIPDGISTPPLKNRVVIDFSPPLVLLPASVNVGTFSAAGKATVRRLGTNKDKSKSVTLNYAVSSEVTTGFRIGVAPGVLASMETAVGRLPVLAISRSLRFSGQVNSTVVSRLTVSDETYAAGVGLIYANVPAGPRGARLTAVRQGFGDDIDGDRRGDMLTLDTGSSNPPSLVASAQGVTKSLLAWHPRIGTTTSTDLGRVPAQTILHGDFDADGARDLLTYDFDSGLVSLLHLGDGSDQAQALAFAPLGLRLFASGDFHHDGHRTLLWRDDAGALSQWRLDGTVLPEVFRVTDQVGTPLRVPPAWTLAGVGDFDANGASDLLWHETAGQRSTLWLMDGAIRIAKSGLPRVDAKRRVMAVNDFDGDGHCDVLWYDPALRQLELWLMNGASVAARNLLNRPPAGAKLLASGDYDGNGNADLLWRKGEQLTLWLLRKGALYKSGDAGDLAPSNTPLP